LVFFFVEDDIKRFSFNLGRNVGMKLLLVFFKDVSVALAVPDVFV
jgi:hypothetical protein